MSIASQPGALGTCVLAASTVLSAFAVSAGRADARQLPEKPEQVIATRALAGAVDIHAHSLPDIVPRSIDGIALAKLARSHGMRGLVLKNHQQSTATLAYIARQEVPGFETFGGIVLNLSSGGINVAAVENMARLTGGWGRVVWMPTLDAEHVVRGSKQQDRPFVAVSRNGELLPEVKKVLSVIAKYELVLATGHSSPEEVLMLIREGRKQGVQHIVVTHPMQQIGMNLAQMQEAAKEGAFLEFTYLSVIGQRPPGPGQYTIAQVAETIRKVGPEFSILSSDLGQELNPLHPDGLAAFVAGLRRQGFAEQDLDRMTKENPARLLGLSVR